MEDTALSSVNESPGVAVDFLRHHKVCPTGILDDGRLIVAVTPQSLLSALDDLSLAYDRPVATRGVEAAELDLLLARLDSAHEGQVSAAQDLEMDLDDGTRDVRDLANQAPVVRYVNLLLREAHEAGASDIHLESTPAGLQARVRVDGVLLPGTQPPGRLDRAVVSRVKLLADLDIADRRRPQDGRMRIRLNDREMDLRVSTVPTVAGESVVLRLLNRSSQALTLEDLGLPGDLLAKVDALARRPHGMLAATGPTGSGKTTTLYAALRIRDRTAEKIITLEDPVEYTIDGVIQVPVHAQTGVTFASALRSILRQDPDVILVGEMRDAETAELATQASLTGHVVFSTLHTNDALGAVPRLIDLGIPPYLVAATLEGVLAQRLARRICGSCRQRYRPDSAAVAGLRSGADPAHEPPAGFEFTRGSGCARCRGTGYAGRIGLFELLEVKEALRDAIATGASRRSLEQVSLRDGMRRLRTDGWLRVLSGDTTVEEVHRVTQA